MIKQQLKTLYENSDGLIKFLIGMHYLVFLLHENPLTNGNYNSDELSKFIEDKGIINILSYNIYSKQIPDLYSEITLKSLIKQIEKSEISSSSNDTDVNYEGMKLEKDELLEKLESAVNNEEQIAALNEAIEYAKMNGFLEHIEKMRIKREKLIANDYYHIQSRIDDIDVMLLKKGKVTNSTQILENQVIEKDIYEVVKILFKVENELIDFYRVRLRQWLINNKYLKIIARYPVLKCEATALGIENGISTFDEQNSDKATIILFNEFAIAMLVENIERINY